MGGNLKLLRARVTDNKINYLVVTKQKNIDNP